MPKAEIEPENAVNLRRAVELMAKDIEDLRSRVNTAADSTPITQAMADIEKRLSGAYQAAVDVRAANDKALRDIREELDEHRKEVAAKVQELTDTNRALGQQNASLKKQLRESKGEK